METKQKTNNTGNDQCICNCYPCFIVWISIVNYVQTSYLCCCQLLVCNFCMTSNEKVSNDDLYSSNDFTEIGINADTIKSSNKDFIIELVNDQLSYFSDDEKKLLASAIQGYKFVNDYDFSFSGKTKLVKYKNNDRINWTASINNQTIDIAEDWSKYHKNTGIEGLILKYK
jgi:hypothetical protein